MDTTVPTYPLFSWPKTVPPLDDEQRRISDDFMRAWHEELPAKYGRIERFNHGYPLEFLPEKPRFRTIEIGAGIGAHIGYEDLTRQEYHAVEIRQNMIDELKRRFPQVHAVKADCQDRLPFEDGYFDRAVVVHVLEHLPDLPRCLDEIRRVLRPGALFSIVIPCDPGLIYELCRKISAERLFKRRYGLPYGWLIRREHINTPKEILHLLNERFEEVERTYFPLAFLPAVNANLRIGATYTR